MIRNLLILKTNTQHATSWISFIQQHISIKVQKLIIVGIYKLILVITHPCSICIVSVRSENLHRVIQKVTLNWLKWTFFIQTKQDSTKSRSNILHTQVGSWKTSPGNIIMMRLKMCSIRWRHCPNS